MLVTCAQSEDVAPSNHMELKGLTEALEEPNDTSVQVAEIIVDGHRQVRKYFRMQQPDVDHQFDTWHISKGWFQSMWCEIDHAGTSAVQ